ncbi:MAG: hypothetical protein ABOK23_02345 [Candidatus Methanoperedens sp.]
MKTCSFRSGRGGRWRGGSDDGVGGEVVMAIEVLGRKNKIKISLR